MQDKQTQDDQSLEEIEGNSWGAPPADATNLVRTAHRLRRTPLRDLDPEDLRLLLTQKLSLDVLIPRTLTLLEQHPLLEGDYYPGDVLVALLTAPQSYWSTNPAHLTRLEQIIDSLTDNPDAAELKPDIEAFHDQRG